MELNSKECESKITTMYPMAKGNGAKPKLFQGLPPNVLRELKTLVGESPGYLVYVLEAIYAGRILVCANCTKFHHCQVGEKCANKACCSKCFEEHTTAAHHRKPLICAVDGCSKDHLPRDCTQKCAACGFTHINQWSEKDVPKNLEDLKKGIFDKCRNVLPQNLLFKPVYSLLARILGLQSTSKKAGAALRTTRKKTGRKLGANQRK